MHGVMLVGLLFGVVRASTAGHPKPPSYARADGPVSDRSKKPDPDGRLKLASNARADRHPSYPA